MELRLVLVFEGSHGMPYGKFGIFSFQVHFWRHWIHICFISRRYHWDVVSNPSCKYPLHYEVSYFWEKEELLKFSFWDYFIFVMIHMIVRLIFWYLTVARHISSRFVGIWNLILRKRKHGYENWISQRAPDSPGIHPYHRQPHDILRHLSQTR